MTVRAVYFLGIDGGGTGCRARLIGFDGQGIGQEIGQGIGEVLGRGCAGPATLRLGADAAWAALMAAADQALGEADFSLASATVHAAIGIAGLSRTSAHAALLAKPHPFAQLTVTTDAHVACLGAHGGADGAIVIAGTGAIGYARMGAHAFTVGGHGFPISDAGSGADIGLQAARIALKAYDGLTAVTPMSTAVLAAMGGDPAHAVAWMDQATATDYATLAPIVVAHAEGGDATAIRLMRAAAGEIGLLIEALVQRGAVRVALVGGLAAPLTPWLSADVAKQLTPALGDGADGAVLLARQNFAALSVEPD